MGLMCGWRFSSPRPLYTQREPPVHTIRTHGSELYTRLEVGMATVRTDFRLPVPLLERVDSARGGETRTRFLVRALEAFLDDVPVHGVAKVTQELNSHSPFAEGPAGTYGVRISSSVAKAGVTPR